MKLAITFLVCFFSIVSLAQKLRFSDSTNRWDVSISSLGGGSCASCKAANDYNGAVSLNGKIYRVLRPTGLSADSALIREDIVAGKVYAIVINSHWTLPDTTEVVLYDYTLQKGDTFTTMHPGVVQHVHVVDSTGQVTVGGIAHKIFHLKLLSSPTPPTFKSEDYWVVEGFGSTVAPLYPYYPSNFEHNESLYCFSSQGFSPLLIPSVDSSSFSYLHSSGILTASMPYDNYNTCKALSINSLENEQGFQLAAIPQPAFASTTIMLPYVLRNGKMKIINIYGQVIQQTSITETSELVVNNPGVWGIYYYFVQDHVNRRTFSGKLIFY